MRKDSKLLFRTAIEAGYGTIKWASRNCRWGTDNKISEKLFPDTQ